MPTIIRRGAFPMRLAPFESYMFADDEVKYPMTFVVQFVLSGTLDRSVLQQAMDFGLPRHPLLRSFVRKAKANRNCWVVPDQYDSRIDFGAPDEPIKVEGAGYRLDLANEIGVRCFARHDDQNAVVTFAFHHTATDGIGAYQFAGDLFWFYAQAKGETVSAPPELDEMLMRSRMSAIIPKHIPYQEIQKPSSPPQPAQPITPHNPSSTNESADQKFPDFQTHVFEKDEYRKLRLAAQSVGQTVNDRLLQSLFESISRWNREHEFYSAEPIIINMPLDLRKTDHPTFSGCNLVTNCLISRTAEEIDNREEFSRLLRMEITRLKYERYESEFMKSLIRIPEETGHKFKREAAISCLTTAVFSNAGDPTKRFFVDLPRIKGKIQIGDLVLDDINGVPPIRRHTRVTISVMTYRRKLKICMRCDPFYFNSSDARAFLDHFVNCFADG